MDYEKVNTSGDETQIESFDKSNHLFDLSRPNPFQLLSNPIAFFRAAADAQGPVARIQFGSQEFVLLNDPVIIEDLLIRQSANFEKFPKISRTRGLFGEGLLTSEEPLHLKQRRLAQPAFHRDRLSSYADEMVASTQRLVAGWKHNQQINAAHEMGNLALDIVSRTLFSTQTDSQAEQIGAALDQVVRTLNHLVTPWGNLLLSFPTPVRRRYRSALEELDGIIYGFIEARRNGRQVHADLLSMLMEAKDPDTGEGMPDLQLRDELMTMFVAGHDTTANALTWTLYLLSQHPEEQALVEAEVDGVLQGKPASIQDASRLARTVAVFRESLRLYPPVWILGRRALRSIDTPLIQLRKGAIVLVSMAILHRRPGLFEEPERFLPGRKQPEAKFAFLPFGAGSRLCIGERFAWLEGVLCLATIVQNWRLSLVPGSIVEPQPLLTLRPRFGLPMISLNRNNRSKPFDSSMG